jgi:hypothetical protein
MIWLKDCPLGIKQQSPTHSLAKFSELDLIGLLPCVLDCMSIWAIGLTDMGELPIVR